MVTYCWGLILCTILHRRNTLGLHCESFDTFSTLFATRKLCEAKLIPRPFCLAVGFETGENRPNDRLSKGSYGLWKILARRRQTVSIGEVRACAGYYMRPFWYICHIQEGRLHWAGWEGWREMLGVGGSSRLPTVACQLCHHRDASTVSRYSLRLWRNVAWSPCCLADGKSLQIRSLGF